MPPGYGPRYAIRASVAIGEPQRAFYGYQFRLTFLLVRAVDQDSATALIHRAE